MHVKWAKYYCNSSVKKERKDIFKICTCILENKTKTPNEHKSKIEPEMNQLVTSKLQTHLESDQMLNKKQNKKKRLRIESTFSDLLL